MSHYASSSRPSLTALDWSTACIGTPAIKVATGKMCFPVRNPRAPDFNWLRMDWGTTIASRSRDSHAAEDAEPSWPTLR